MDGSDIARSETGQLELMVGPVDLTQLFDGLDPDMEDEMRRPGWPDARRTDTGATIHADSAKR